MLLEIVITNFVFVDGNFQLQRAGAEVAGNAQKSLSLLQSLRLNHLC